MLTGLLAHAPAELASHVTHSTWPDKTAEWRVTVNSAKGRPFHMVCRQAPNVIMTNKMSCLSLACEACTLMLPARCRS